MSEEIKENLKNPEETNTNEESNASKVDVKPKKSKARKVLGYCGFIVGIVAVLCVACMFLKMTEPVNVASLQGIYKEKNTLDVVVIGASEAYANYCAPLAYEEYGYTSYSYGVSGVPGSLYKSMVREVLDNQNPKLIVIEMNGLLQQDYYYDRQGNLHGYLDNINYGDNRDEAIEYAVADKDKDDFKTINFLNVYHNSWKDSGKCIATLFTRIGMFLEPKSNLKGYSTRAKIASADDLDITKSNHFTDKSRMIFDDLMTYCNERGLQNVLFVRFPHMNKDTEPEIAEELTNMANAHGYKFVDFSHSKEEAGIVPVYDYYNDEHFNARGARKFTSYFGNYLVNNYDLKANYSDELKKSWEDSVAKTEEILTRAEQDIDKNLGRNYYELSVYLPKWFKV